MGKDQNVEKRPVLHTTETYLQTKETKNKNKNKKTKKQKMKETK